MRWLGPVCVLLGVCCAGHLPDSVGAPPPRDIDLLHEAVTGACGTVLRALPSNSIGQVVIDQVGQDKGAWLIEEALCEGLLVKGWEVRQSRVGASERDTASADERLVLEYRIVKMDMRYRPLGKPLWGSLRVERQAEVELAFKLVDEEGGLLVWLGRGSDRACGVVDGAALPTLAHADFSPPVEDWPRSRPWVAEVALTTGLVGLLLAVFYAGTV